MKTYLVESYVPRSRAATLDAAVQRLRATVGSPGDGAPVVRYLRSTFVADDEICFHVFEAGSAEAVRKETVRDAGDRALVTFDRIVEVVE